MISDSRQIFNHHISFIFFIIFPIVHSFIRSLIRSLFSLCPFGGFNVKDSHIKNDYFMSTMLFLLLSIVVMELFVMSWIGSLWLRFSDV